MLHQRLVYVGPQAVDVDVKLGLRPRLRRVDREAHPIARQRPSRTLLDEGTCAPRGREVVRCLGSQDRRTLDAGDATGRDEHKLQRSDEVIQYDMPNLLSGGEVNLRTGGGVTVLSLFGDTAAIDDVPQRIRISLRCSDTRAGQH